MYKSNIDFWIERSRQEKTVAAAGSMVGAGAGVAVCYYVSSEPPKTVQLLDQIIDAFNSASGGLLEPAAEQSRGEAQPVQTQARESDPEPLPLPAELGIIGVGALLGVVAYGAWAVRASYRKEKRAFNKELEAIIDSESKDR